MERYFLVFYRGFYPGKTDSTGFSRVTTTGNYVQVNTYIKHMKESENLTACTITNIIELSITDFEDSKK